MTIRTIPVMVPVTADGIRGDLPMQLSEQCATCANLRSGLKCRAFPRGIPEAITSGQYNHRLPFKGDHGIRYEPITIRR